MASKTQLTLGAAATRAANCLPRGTKRATLVEARRLAAERPFHKGLVSAEHVLMAAGVPEDRIPVLAARLRTGAKAKVDFKKEVAAS